MFYCFFRSSVDGASESSGNHRCEFAEAIRELAAEGKCYLFAFLFLSYREASIPWFQTAFESRWRFLWTVSPRPSVAGHSSLHPSCWLRGHVLFVCEGGQALAWTVSYSFGLSFPPQSFDTESISHVTLKSWFFFCTGNIFSVTSLQSQLVRAISPSSVFKQLRRKHSALKGWCPGRALSLMKSSGGS